MCFPSSAPYLVKFLAFFPILIPDNEDVNVKVFIYMPSEEGP